MLNLSVPVMHQKDIVPTNSYIPKWIRSNHQPGVSLRQILILVYYIEQAQLAARKLDIHALSLFLDNLSVIKSRSNGCSVDLISSKKHI